MSAQLVIQNIGIGLLLAIDITMALEQVSGPLTRLRVTPEVVIQPPPSIVSGMTAAP